MDKIIEPTMTPMPEPKQEFEILPGEELRINKIGDHLKILMIEGKAEVFGRELPLKMPVVYHQGEKIAIYTFHGAKVQLSGRC